MFFLISISLICASENVQVEKAYSCVESKINQSNCSTGFSFEEKVFSLLATGNLKCQNATMLENISSPTSLCWPKSGCKLKPTAQAVFALNEKVNTTKAENWLLAQNSTPTDMDWFLEIESSSATSCLINYSGSPSTVLIGEDKKINSNAGTYLTLAQDNYWLKISPLIYNKDIKISCNKPFITTLLFKKKDSSTVHVSETVHSAAANGTTTEKVDSSCFSQNGVCNYEGSLWATFVLYSLDYDVSRFIPYLTTMIDNDLNKAYIPESFLYLLTGKFRTELLIKQRMGLYWEESGDKYYDTALALWPFYFQTLTEKANSKTWLLGNQQNTGCWNDGNLRDTAFILYSIWPKSSSPPGKCTFNSDCPEVSCKESSCSDGVCSYNSLSCAEDDNCCKICDSNIDCNIYVESSNKYCSVNETQVWQNTSTWTCVNKVCVVDEKPKKIETCARTEKCDAGNCLFIGDIPDECSSDFECVDGETCIDGGCYPDEPLDCEDEGNYCRSKITCEEDGGSVIEDYSCITGVDVCCDTKPSVGKCSGEICASDEVCTGGTTEEASDPVYGEICCVGGGTCKKEITPPTSDCEYKKGICKSSCGSKEKEGDGALSESCDFGEICCTAETKKPSHIWIWILLFLILISALGIVFRDKLRVQWMKLKENFGGKQEKKKFEMPLTSHPNPQGRILPRGILPPQSSSPRPPIKRPISSQRPTINKKPEERPKNELDDVLKKLKEMGK